jgi:hypothetical protein
MSYRQKPRAHGENRHCRRSRDASATRVLVAPTEEPRKQNADGVSGVESAVTAERLDLVSTKLG